MFLVLKRTILEIRKLIFNYALFILGPAFIENS